MKPTALLNLTATLAITLMLGWLFYIGQAIIIPIIIAVIVVYIVNSASATLKRIPGLAALPSLAFHLVILLFFALLFAGLGLVVATTVQQLIAVAPSYESNLQQLATRIADTLQIDEVPNWSDVRSATLGQINIKSALVWFLSGLTSMGSTLFLVIVYAIFIVGERVAFAERVANAFSSRGQADQLLDILSQVNTKIGNYLTVKTLINVILGVISYLVMRLMGVDFALFWAIVIGLTNYIPYFGSLIGVMLPVILSLAQFASISTTLILAILLTVAQAYVGNVLEPRWIGRELNLSPLVVLIALAFWAAIWGVPGAILAIPMTSVIVIILGSFEQSRFAAVLLSQRADDRDSSAS